MLAVLLLSKMRKARNSIATTPSFVINANERPCCRTCLSSIDLVDIFSDKKTEKIRMENLRIITGVDIKMNDGLPQKICRACRKIVNMALKFRINCKNAEKSLLSAVTQVKDQEDVRPLKRVSARIKKEKSVDISTDPDYSDDIYDTGNDCQNYEEFDQEDEEVESKSKLKKVLKASGVRKQYIPTQASYKCEDCSKVFKMKATYLSHIRFHSSFCICEECGKRCRNKYQLMEHKRAKHGHDKIHKCSYCEYSSATKEALVIHERRHTGERPYICDHCGASFTRRSNLVQHIAIHLPEKNFQCSICFKKEKSRKRLQVHVYQQHRVNKYKYICPICRDTFSRPGNVRCHLARGHGMGRPHQPRAIERCPRNSIPEEPPPTRPQQRALN